MSIFSSLNEAQQQAASHIDGALLILAGAGSGKTKTITTRLAYLIGEVGIHPSNTLTLTFTNKAAYTMRNRAFALLKNNTNYQPLLCTFHRFGLLFLKLHIEKLGFANNFKVIDSDDSKKIVKDLIDSELKISPSLACDAISNFKNSLLTVDDAYNMLDENKKYIELGDVKIENEKLVKIYKLYQDSLKKYAFLDFDDLLLLSYELLKKDESFAKEQSRLYNYITVDEYQDTNTLQLEILKLLCKEHSNLCVVGDDDQSIYSWRGARIENILNFSKDFKDAKIIKLEHNYRSSAKILAAANALISHNTQRHGKTLISTKEEGEDIRLLSFDDDRSEAFEIAQLVKKELALGTRASEIAILYRRNILSSLIDNEFRKQKISYKVLSGIKFHERMEIKDAISYLRFISNTDDDYSFLRIINKPKRGLGKAFIAKLQHHASLNKSSLFEAISYCVQNRLFTDELCKKLENFASSILSLQACELSSIIDGLESVFALSSSYDEDYKKENLKLLYNEMKAAIAKNNYTSLNDLLSDFSLQSEQDAMSDDENCVYLMSVHASKGLEFDVVFIIGLENGNFPIHTSNEEERRLAYVAITRAKKKLYLSRVEYRSAKSAMVEAPSIFLDELALKADVNKGDFKKGDLVKHKIFGIGRVLNVTKENAAQECKLDISFGGIQRSILSSFVTRI